MRKILIGLCIITGIWSTAAIHAADIPETVIKRAKKLGLDKENVFTTPAAGLYEIQAGAQIFYITADGKYLLAGKMLDMDTRDNLTEERLKGVRLKAIDVIPSDQMISFKAKDEKYQITVFTDIDCGYCRKLHSEMTDYNQQGISVNYLMFPRTGLGSPSYNKAVSVWCSKDRNKALTEAKAGADFPAAKCDNPVARHMMLGSELGVGGTPYMVTQDGTALPGYLPPAQLRKELDKMKLPSDGLAQNR